MLNNLLVSNIKTSTD